MRGRGEPTVMSRIYQSTNDALTRWIAIKNAHDAGMRRWDRAEVIDAIIKENKRMKDPIQFLQIDNAALARKAKAAEEKLKTYEKVYTV
jgi:hypothetical protein